MPATIPFFLERVQEAAILLNTSETIELITAVKNQLPTSKLQLLIVGATGVGRFSLANTILGQPELLPISAIPKASISVIVSYGETLSTEITQKNGVRTVIPQEKLRTFLTNSNTDYSQYLNIEIKTNCALLKTCDIRLESINSKKSLNDWKELLVGIDYCILVLKATALLSERERQFIREILRPNLGLQRVAIVLNQMDLVPEDEHPSIMEMVRTFLGSFDQTLILEFSSSQALEAIKSGNLPQYDYDVLNKLVKIDLVEKHSLLKYTAICQAAEICLNEVAEQAANQILLIETKKAEFQSLLDKIDSQNQWLENRIQRAQQKIEVFINTLIKEDFFREIEGFGLAIREQLPNEIAPLKDITTIKRHLPGYLEAVWTEFFNVQIPTMQNKLIRETKLITQKVEADLKELLGDDAITIVPLKSNFASTPANLRNFLLPRRGKNEFSFLATGLQLGGFLLLVANLPLGLTAIGTGQLVRLFNSQVMETSDLKALLTSANETVGELEKQIKQQVESQFSELTQQLKATTADLYHESISQISSFLRESQADHQELIAKKEQIERLVNVTIPELKQMFKQLN